MTKSETSQLDFKIEGMTCGSCAARVTKALEGISGAHDVSVNFALRSGHLAGSVSREDVEQAVQNAGYRAVFAVDVPEGNAGSPTGGEIDAREEIATSKRRLQFAAILGLPVPVLAITPLGHLNYLVDYSGGLQAVLTTLLLVGPGRGFFIRSWHLLRNRSLNMDSLVALGVGSAWIYSVWQVARVGQNAPDHLYFESAVMITVFVLAGRWLEERARHAAVDAITSLAKMRPRVALVRNASGTSNKETTRDVEVPIDLVKVGDHLVVAAGRAIPADGRIVDGKSDIDESLVSGEQMPVTRYPGDSVVGGTINIGPGILLIAAEKTGQDTFLAKVLDLVQGAQAMRPAIQKLVDEVAARFVPAVVVIAILTFLFWIQSGVDVALQAALAVLVIACPCALGLATPTALLAGTGRAARMGVLIRDPDALQDIHRADCLVVDKTGTVTSANLKVVDQWLNPEFSSSQGELVRRMFYAAQSQSSHPVAKAVTEFLLSGAFDGLPMSRLDFGEIPGQIDEIAGRGVVARFIVDGRVHVVAVGNDALVSDQNAVLPRLHSVANQNEPASVVWLVMDRQIIGRLLLRAEIPESASDAVGQLKNLGIDVVMASGDRDEIVRHVAEKVGIRSFHAAMLPSGKLELIRSLQDSGRHVIMAGDGINDAPALAQANVGIAVGGGSDIAIGSAGLVIPSGQLNRIADAISLSKKTVKIIRQNLFWAFFYNVVAIPVAALGWLSPMVAAAAMALSSVSVVTNSLRLMRFNSGGIR